MTVWVDPLDGTAEYTQVKPNYLQWCGSGKVYPGSELSMPDPRFRVPTETTSKWRNLRKKQCVGEESGTGSVYRYTETGFKTLKKTLAERHLRCCGFVTFWYGSDPDPWTLLFSPEADKMPTKNRFFQSFLLFTFGRHILNRLHTVD